MSDKMQIPTEVTFSCPKLYRVTDKDEHIAQFLSREFAVFTNTVLACLPNNEMKLAFCQYVSEAHKTVIMNIRLNGAKEAVSEEDAGGETAH